MFQRGAIRSRRVANYVEESVIIVKRRTDAADRKVEPVFEAI
jgi:hypothetical protein